MKLVRLSPIVFLVLPGFLLTVSILLEMSAKNPRRFGNLIHGKEVKFANKSLPSIFYRDGQTYFAVPIKTRFNPSLFDEKIQFTNLCASGFRLAKFENGALKPATTSAFAPFQLNNCFQDPVTHVEMTTQGGDFAVLSEVYSDGEEHSSLVMLDTSIEAADFEAWTYKPVAYFKSNDDAVPTPHLALRRGSLFAGTGLFVGLVDQVWNRGRAPSSASGEELPTIWLSEKFAKQNREGTMCFSGEGSITLAFDKKSNQVGITRKDLDSKKADTVPFSLDRVQQDTATVHSLTCAPVSRAGKTYFSFMIEGAKTQKLVVASFSSKKEIKVEQLVPVETITYQSWIVKESGEPVLVYTAAERLFAWGAQSKQSKKVGLRPFGARLVPAYTENNSSKGFLAFSEKYNKKQSFYLYWVGDLAEPPQIQKLDL